MGYFTITYHKLNDPSTREVNKVKKILEEANINIIETSPGVLLIKGTNKNILPLQEKLTKWAISPTQIIKVNPPHKM